MVPCAPTALSCEYLRVTQGAEYVRKSLNMPEEYLRMREYALTMLNVLEYARIYLNKQSSQNASLLDLSDAVHIIGHYTNYWAVIKTDIFE